MSDPSSKNLLLVVLGVALLIVGFLYVGMSQRLKEVEIANQELSIVLEERQEEISTLNDRIKQIRKTYNEDLEKYMRSQGVILHPSVQTPTQSL